MSFGGSIISRALKEGGNKRLRGAPPFSWSPKHKAAPLDSTDNGTFCISKGREVQ